MMRYAVFVAFVAQALQGSARRILPHEALYRRSIGHSEIDDSDKYEVKASWHRHADEGYPEFDGNPFKKSLASGTSNITISFIRDVVEKTNEPIPPVVEEILRSAQEQNWKNFEEYMDFWGAAINAGMKEAKKEYKRVTGEEYSNDNHKYDIGDITTDFKSFMRWVFKLENHFAHDNLWHADKGYPEFDGNPLKILLAHGTTDLSGMYLKRYKPFSGAKRGALLSDLIIILEDSQKANWKNFDEYLEFMGVTLPALEKIKKNMIYKANEGASNNNSNDGSDDDMSMS